MFFCYNNHVNFFTSFFVALLASAPIVSGVETHLRTSLIAAAGAAAELVVEGTLRLSTTLAGIAAVA